MSLPDPLVRLIEQFQRLPGIGAKGAARLAFHVLRTPREDAERLCDANRGVKERVTYCSVCNNINDADPCDELADAQILRIDPFDRIDRTVEHMVETAILAGALDR